MTKVCTSVDKWRALRQCLAPEKKSIGFVPTMGNLHAGHESLLQKSKQENTISVLTEILGEFNFSG